MHLSELTMIPSKKLKIKFGNFYGKLIDYFHQISDKWKTTLIDLMTYFVKLFSIQKKCSIYSNEARKQKQQQNKNRAELENALCQIGYAFNLIPQADLKFSEQIEQEISHFRLVCHMRKISSSLICINIFKDGNLLRASEFGEIAIKCHGAKTQNRRLTLDGLKES